MKTFPASQLIINADGSAFHLHLKPEFLADKIILVGDQDRVNIVASLCMVRRVCAVCFSADLDTRDR